MNQDYAVVVENLEKSFRLPHEKHTSLKQTILNWRKRSFEEQEVLKDISFKVKKGEFFGIVGRNGSGKSTLLKTIAGIYQPNAGGVNVNGALTPFIELGIGFNDEITGRDNVFLNGAILGLSRKEIEKKYDEIVEFAELERFMDQKVKNYSSGMQVRLAFSIAIQAHNEVLLIDEVLAVGDESFQRKCFEHFKTLKKEKKTVVFVSHDMETVRSFCDRAILIEDGKILTSGKSNVVATKYQQLNLPKDQTEKTKNSSDKTKKTNLKASIDSITTFNQKKKKTKLFQPHDIINVEVNIKILKALENPVVGITIEDGEGRILVAANTIDTDNVNTPKKLNKGSLRAVFSFENILNDGDYFISAAIAGEIEGLYDRKANTHKIMSGGWRRKHALVHPKYKVKVYD